MPLVRTNGCIAVGCVAVMVVTAPWEGTAQESKNPLIAEGIKQHNDLEYEASINTLSAALIRPGNSDAERIEIYKYLGLNYLILGRMEEAEGAFRSLLAIDEEWTFDPVTTPPKVLEFWEATRRRWISEGKPGLERRPVSLVEVFHSIPEKGVRGHEVNLKIEVKNPQRIPIKVKVSYRTGSEGAFQEAIATMKGYVDEAKEKAIYIASIPGDCVRSPFVDYFIAISDAAGNPIGAKGDEATPLRIPVPEETRKRRGLIWGLAGGLGGVALVGLVLGVALPLALREEPPSQRNATVTIIVCEEGPGCS